VIIHSVHEVKIDTLSGAVSFGSGMIRGDQPRTDFLATELGSSSMEEIANAAEDWRRVRVPSENEFDAILLYQGERLRQVYIAITTPSDKHDEWTMESELRRKDFHDNWLRTELGDPPYNYAWGSVVSEFDAKGVVSEIIVTYAQ
jgi:hypothetical protein